MVVMAMVCSSFSTGMILTCGRSGHARCTGKASRSTRGRTHQVSERDDTLEWIALFSRANFHLTSHFISSVGLLSHADLFICHQGCIIYCTGFLFPGGLTQTNRLQYFIFTYKPSYLSSIYIIYYHDMPTFLFVVKVHL